MSDLTQAHAIASDLMSHLDEGKQDPMQATLAVAIALGCMVQSLNELGITKQGRSRELLETLFKISEQTAIAGATL